MITAALLLFLLKIIKNIRSGRKRKREIHKPASEDVYIQKAWARLILNHQQEVLL